MFFVAEVLAFVIITLLKFSSLHCLVSICMAIMKIGLIYYADLNLVSSFFFPGGHSKCGKALYADVLFPLKDILTPK